MSLRLLGLEKTRDFQLLSEAKSCLNMTMTPTCLFALKRVWEKLLMGVLVWFDREAPKTALFFQELECGLTVNARGYYVSG